MASPSYRTLRCTVIGAGFSGLLMAYKLQAHLKDYVEINILEKSPQLGGTWWENNYPGCACDVPSHCYQYSFATNPDWTKFYSSSEEIKDYLDRFACHFGIKKLIQFNSKVQSARWSEAKGTWTVTVEGRGQIESEILINAGGILNSPQLPKISGWDSFLGPKLHTAAWDKTVPLENKRIAVIGAGASAIQLVPELKQICEEIDVFIRTPSWICPPLALNTPGAANYEYSQKEKDDFRKNPSLYLQTRKQIESQFNAMFPMFTKGSDEQRNMRLELTKHMKSLITDETLQRHLIPGFEVGCRRVSPGERFLKALQEENVRPIFDPIDSVTASGIIVQGKEHRYDAIVAATGFDTSFRPRFPIIGRNDVDLQELWADRPVSYLGTGVSGFPNYFTFLGPNTPISNGSVIGPIEASGDYFVKIIRKMIREGIEAVDVRIEAQNDFDAHTQAFMKNMVWTGSCRSWFKAGTDGRVSALWPGSSLHYMQTLAESRWEDYEWRRSRGRFEYWRRGISWVEDPKADPLGLEQHKALLESSTIPQEGADLSYYLCRSEPLPRSGLFSGETSSASFGGPDLESGSLVSHDTPVSAAKEKSGGEVLEVRID